MTSSFSDAERRLLAFSQEERDRILDADAAPKAAWQSALEAAKAKESATLQQVRAVRDKPVEAFKEPRFTVKSWGGFKKWFNSVGNSAYVKQLCEQHDAEQQEGRKKEIEAVLEAEAEAEWKKELSEAESKLTGAASDAQRYVLLQGRILNRDVALAAGRVEACRKLLEGIDAQIAVLTARQQQFRDLAALVAKGGVPAPAEDVEIEGMAELKRERDQILGYQGRLEERARELIARKKPSADEKRAEDLDALLTTVLTSADAAAAVDLDEMILEAVTADAAVRGGEVVGKTGRNVRRLDGRLADLVARRKISAEQRDRLLAAVDALRSSDRAGVLSYFAKKTQKRVDALPAGRVLNPPDIKDRVGMLAFMKPGETVKIGVDSWSVVVPDKDGRFTVLAGDRGQRAVVERSEDGGAFLMRVRDADGRKTDVTLSAPKLPADARRDVLYLWPKSSVEPAVSSLAA